MNQYRKDPLSGRWTIINEAQPWSTDDYPKVENKADPRIVSPFIYGQEKATPPEIDAFRPGKVAPDTPNWKVRVVPNKFPALQIGGDLEIKQNGLYQCMQGVGAHEVIIETPDPQLQMANYDDLEIKDVLLMCQRRYLDLKQDDRFRYIAIFKNFGQSAGASIYHAHSQLIALPMVPLNVLDKLQQSRLFYEKTGKSLFAEILEREICERDRLIEETKYFVNFCPFAPRYAFQMCIMPKDVKAAFEEFDYEVLQDLGVILRNALKRIELALGNPALNYYLQAPPVNTELIGPFTWHVEVMPKLNHFAEFDREVGFFTVQTPPEMAAQILRRVL